MGGVGHVSAFRGAARWGARIEVNVVWFASGVGIEVVKVNRRVRVRVTAERIVVGLRRRGSMVDLRDGERFVTRWEDGCEDSEERKLRGEGGVGMVLR